jgi:hypothetical protein
MERLLDWLLHRQQELSPERACNHRLDETNTRPLTFYTFEQKFIANPLDLKFEGIRTT